MFNGGRKSGQLYKTPWLSHWKLPSNLHLLMPEKHLFSKQLCSCIKIRATQTHSETIYRPKWFLEHLFLLEHYCLLSLRVSDVLVHFQPYAPSPMKMHLVLLLLGCLLKTLLEKMQLLAVLCIAKWIQLSAAQCPHKVTAIEGNSYMKETQVWLEELDVLTTSTHTSYQLDCVFILPESSSISCLLCLPSFTCS